MIGKNQIFSDETIRRFLLGELSARQREQIEYSLFTDNTLEERVRLAELELSDDYAANRLSGAARDLFRRRFLLTAERERELEVSQALRATFGHAFVIRESFWERFANFCDIRRHAWKYAFAALTLVLMLLATALLIKKERSGLVESFRPPRVAPKPSATSTPRMTNHSENAPPRSHSENYPTLPSHEGLATSVVLTSETSLDAAPIISSSGEVVTVQLKLNSRLAESYEVNVRTTAGESVFFASGLKRLENEMVSFDLPRTGAGDYQIELTRIEGESRESAGTYYFRVR